MSIVLKADIQKKHIVFFAKMDKKHNTCKILFKTEFSVC